MLVHILVASLAQTIYAIIPDMVVVEYGELTTVGETTPLTVLIPNHAKRGSSTVFSRDARVTHTFSIKDKTISFNCKAGHELDCSCSMEAKYTNVASSSIAKVNCDYKKDPRNMHGRCLVQFNPNAGFDLANFGTCTTMHPEEQPKAPATLEIVSLRTFLVPKQPVAWAVMIGRKKMAVKCGTEDTCTCSIVPIATNARREDHTCSSLTPPSRDSEGNCRVSYFALSPEKISCNTLGDDEVEKSRHQYFQVARQAIDILEEVTLMNDFEVWTLSVTKELATSMETMPRSRQIGSNKFDNNLEMLTKVYKLLIDNRLKFMNGILTDVDVSDKEGWRSKISAWEDQSKTLNHPEFEKDLPSREHLLSGIDEVTRKFLLEVNDKLESFVKSPQFVEKSKAWQFKEIWENILDSKKRFDAVKSKA